MKNLINKIFPIVTEENKNDQLDEVNMDFIRYANCWEDANLLLNGLGNQRGNKILSIASGGDNSFSLLTCNPEMVVAVDINETQLFLVELKREAIRAFTHAEYLSFIGFTDGRNRIERYHSIREQLSTSASAYWDVHIDRISNGLVYEGKFEKYLSTFCNYVLPLIHSPQTIKKLLVPKSAVEQEKFVNECWNTRAWRSLFKIFFSRFILGKFGRDPKFLKEVDISVSSYLLKKATTYLSTPHCQNNWMLQFILQGDFSGHLPHYVQRENYVKIKKNIDCLVLQRGLVEDAIKMHGTFDAFNLSNIFEYMDKDTFSKVGHQLIDGSNSEAKFAYWNLMVPRQISSLFHMQLKKNEPCGSIDNGFFYRDFLVDQRHDMVF